MKNPQQFPDPWRKFPIRPWALKAAATGLFLMTLVWQHIQATRLGYEVEKARQRILALRSANGALQIELETMLSPAQICLQARGRMGMSLAAPESLRILAGPVPAEPQPGFLQRLISVTRRVLAGPVAT